MDYYSFLRRQIQFELNDVVRRILNLSVKEKRSNGDKFCDLVLLFFLFSVFKASQFIDYQIINISTRFKSSKLA